MKVEELIKQARIAQEKSYSPYSHFRVGAIIELKDGTLIEGTNIENAAYSLCCCAERVAMFQMHMRGYKADDVISITIVGDGTSFVTPCGSCRQVMAELLNKDTIVYCVNDRNEYRTFKVEELLPLSFNKEDLK